MQITTDLISPNIFNILEKAVHVFIMRKQPGFSIGFTNMHVLRASCAFYFVFHELDLR
jgi:hypothetical protein